MRIFVLMAVLLSAWVARGEAQDEDEGVHKLLIVETYQKKAYWLTVDARTEKFGEQGDTLPVELQVSGYLFTGSNQDYPEKFFPNYEAMREYVEATYCTPNHKPQGKMYFVPRTEHIGSSRFYSNTPVPEVLRDEFNPGRFTIEVRYGKGERASVFGEMETINITCRLYPTPLPTIRPND